MLRKTVTLSFLMFLLCVSLKTAWASEAPVLGMPLIAPEYGAPPRAYYDSKLVNITFKTTPEALQKLIPKPMVANPENLVTVYLGHFNTPDYKTGDFEFKGEVYNEIGFVAPVSLLNKAGGYSLFLYLDKTVPAISGREIWGFPKKEAEIVMTEENGKVAVSVTRLGKTLMKATFEKTAKVDPIPKMPPRVRYNLKYIPSVRKDAPPDVMQITSYSQENKVKELYSGKATLELGGSSVDPLNQIPVLKIVRAEYMVLDGGVDYGDVVYDYLKQGEK